jgi:hypothetical protein
VEVQQRSGTRDRDSKSPSTPIAPHPIRDGPSRFRDAAQFGEQIAEIGRSTGRLTALASGLAAAATWYTMAGDPDTALRLATEGLAAARRLGNPSTIGLSLAALAGALADSDPDRAAALLREGSEYWASRLRER